MSFIRTGEKEVVQNIKRT